MYNNKNLYHGIELKIETFSTTFNGNKKKKLEVFEKLAVLLWNGLLCYWDMGTKQQTDPQYCDAKKK